jgi:type I restriction enzyme S subunit
MKNGWREEIFSDFVEINPSIKMLKGSKYPCVMMEDIIPGHRYVRSPIRKEYKSGSRFENGDTLFARITPCLENGKIAQYKSETNISGFGSTEFFVFRSRDNLSDQSFVFYLATTDTIRKPAEKSMFGVSGRQRADLNVVENIVVKVPDIQTQRRIASILSAYDDLIENNTRRINILEEMARLIYREWFVEWNIPVETLHATSLQGNKNGLRLRKATSEEKKVTGKDVFPVEWEVKSISDVVEILGGGTPSKEKQEYWKDGNITWYTPSDLTKTKMMFAFESGDKITEVGLKKSSARLFPAYSIMMTSRATIGVVAINTHEASTNQGFIVCIPTKDIPMHYLYYWVLSNVERSLNNATGSTYKEIIKSVYRGFPIIIPLKQVMNKFVDIQNPVFRQIESLIRQNINLRQTRDLLLPKLISGEVEV